MNRTLRRRLTVVATASSFGVLSPVWGPILLRELPVFGVEQLRVQGARFVAEEDIDRLAALKPEASVWDDMRAVEAAVAGHPLITDARIRRSGIHRLDIEVREVQPVVLAATPRLVPLDASGWSVPIEPSAHDLDLPVLLGCRMSEDGRVEPEAARRSLDVLEQLSTVDSVFTRQISSLRPVGGEAVEFTLLPGSSVNRVVLPFRDAVKAFLRVERAVGAAEAGGSVTSADARFRGEVVLRMRADG